MKYKLLALDMDGTVLNNKKEISEKTMAAIRRAMELGVIVTIATGRSWQSLEPYQALLALLPHPLIVFNGGMVLSPDGEEVFYQQNLSPEAALEVIGVGQTYGVTQYIWSNGTLHADGVMERIKRDTGEVGVGHLMLEDAEALAREGISKVLWSAEVDQIGAYQRALPAVLQARDMHYFTSGAQYLEFVDHRVSKGAALARFAAHFGIKPEEVIAVGDGMNDVTMLEYAGLGVAMGNAPEALKQVADFVTLTNEEDGVAHVIEQFIVSGS